HYSRCFHIATCLSKKEILLTMAGSEWRQTGGICHYPPGTELDPISHTWFKLRHLSIMANLQYYEYDCDGEWKCPKMYCE
ncbi:hypothetical protein HispidOSU_015726, partial [Sigmodon hispidus]